MENVQENKLGKIRISEEVVSTIAGMEAIKVKGIAGMSGGIKGGINEMLGIRDLSKGVKTAITDKGAIIDCYIVTDYECKIPDVAWEVQEKIKAAIEIMTGLIVIEVNINVQGIKFSKQEHTV